MSPTCSSNFFHFTSGAESFINKNRHRMNKPIEQRRNGWIPFVFVPSLALRTTHKHFVSSSLMPKSLSFPPPSKTSCARRPHISSTELVEVPVPCATCRGHSHFLRSFFISPFGANSRAARLLHSSTFRYLFIPFHSAAPHSITPFRNPHGSISFFPTLALGSFPFFILRS